MSPVDLTSNYFDLFDIPVSFAVDLHKLAEKYRSLQHAVHPDKYVKGTDQERRLSVQQSAFINEAYQVLKQPLTRAKYLLELKGIDVSEQGGTAMAPEFLMQQMELREALAAVKDSSDAAGRLLTLSAEIAESTNQLIRDIDSMFGQVLKEHDQSQWNKIQDYVQRLQFMVKLNDEVQAAEEELI